MFRKSGFSINRLEPPRKEVIPQDPEVEGQPPDQAQESKSIVEFYSVFRENREDSNLKSFIVIVFLKYLRFWGEVTELKLVKIRVRETFSINSGMIKMTIISFIIIKMKQTLVLFDPCVSWGKELPTRAKSLCAWEILSDFVVLFRKK